ncbi:MAG: dihydroneopterin aldolase [Bacteroidales bacterium]|nr:dihydroneopterin aldolase [Prevotella sp.]MBQ3983459.1 dihydroneopterin aldolase [Bacteroidales bacterium]
MSTISLNGMHFYAYHGCFAEEQKIGTYFTVDVEFETDTSRAQQSDDIAHTVSYLDVYHTIRREMMIPSHLLEHVGDRIGEALLKEYPAIERVKVGVSKMNPPLGGQLDSVTVEITKDRSQRN